MLDVKAGDDRNERKKGTKEERDDKVAVCDVGKEGGHERADDDGDIREGG